MEKEPQKTDKDINIFCVRLRQVRKLLNYRIADIAVRTGLSPGQIQRLEGCETKQRGKVIYSGADGRARTLIALLLYYSQHISIDMLFDFNIPVTDIPLDKVVKNDIAKAKISTLIEQLHEVIKYLG